MIKILNNKVLITSQTSMDVENYKQWQFDNMKMYCEMMVSNCQASTKVLAATRISDIQCELVEHFGFTWEQVEKKEIEYMQGN